MAVERYRKRTDALAGVLGCLAVAEKPLTKYEIWKQTCLRQERLYDAVKELKGAGLIRVAKTAKWRTGLTSEKYIVDEKEGKIWAAIMNPGMEKKILGEKKGMVLANETKINHRCFVDFILAEFREILLSNKGPPNYRTELTIQTDSKGKPIARWKVRGHEFSGRASSAEKALKHMREKTTGPSRKSTTPNASVGV